MQAKYDRGDIRRLNAVSALKQLRENGPLSRAQIADRLGLTRATVSAIVADLIGASLVTESQYEEGGVGRRGMLLDLNPSCGSMVAVELDIDRVEVVLANLGMKFLWRGESSLSAPVSAEEGLRRAGQLVEQAVAKSAELGLPCFGIGVAWAGLVKRATGELAYGPTSGWESVAIKDEWEAKFRLPVYVENEAHAGAIAAHHLGEPRGVRDLIYLSLGVGLSSGVFVDGGLLRGSQGYAGQVGHTPFVAEGHQCSCGRKGCWVTEIGAAGVLRKLRTAGVELPSGADGNLDWIPEICAMAKEGDSRIRNVLAEEGRQIGEGLAQLIQVFNPSQVVIGGHLRDLLVLCEEQVRSTLREKVLYPMGKEVSVLVSASPEDQLMGCLATVFDAVMQNPMPISAS
ncbi:ROK family transcriptional regulator [Pelagicoccus sp. NFK12]|uniref:ROK family transcriptional regulator n=1 Tax=Pelagicoccus enzymogenes TaxID=2773457 RepID=A0A927F9Z5_9BACT|nr:ROK family transcriptional regulator [Pelagicoccus enzymogenes]MBD5779628.1 ROK family transcriptional regulator [Pelagicoccus enzymogenes]MDQ8200413.1 ROK family transcriptional regulator [Pelagicoccus enzymogenes]